jgi:two-component system response regulator FixJ
LAADRDSPAAEAGRERGAPASVWVVDDDEAVRDSLGMLLRSVGLEIETFASANDLLDSLGETLPGCLVLDVRLPGMSGLELQKELAARDVELPIVFITGHGDVPMAVRAMQAGAVDFLEKPFKEQDLLDRVSKGLLVADRRRQRSGETTALAQRFETLTPREREVLELVVEGAANKVIASRLGASRRTIEIHRANVMKKMRADSLAHLVRMVMRLEASGRRAASAPRAT